MQIIKGISDNYAAYQNKLYRTTEKVHGGFSQDVITSSLMSENNVTWNNSSLTFLGTAASTDPKAQQNKTKISINEVYDLANTRHKVESI